jgi:hypothetical protein
MFKVLIDLEHTRDLNCPVGRFCFHLGQSLLAADDPQIEPRFLLSDNPPADLSPARASMPTSHWRREFVQKFVRPLVASSASRAEFDLWHATHQNTEYLPLRPSIPLVLTIHDLSFLRTKERARSIFWRLGKLQKKVDRATIITTVSQGAADDIREHLDLRSKQIVIIPPASPITWSAAARQYLDLYKEVLGLTALNRAA